MQEPVQEPVQEQEAVQEAAQGPVQEPAQEQSYQEAPAVGGDEPQASAAEGEGTEDAGPPPEQAN